MLIVASAMGVGVIEQIGCRPNSGRSSRQRVHQWLVSDEEHLLLLKARASPLLPSILMTRDHCWSFHCWWPVPPGSLG